MGDKIELQIEQESVELKEKLRMLRNPSENTQSKNAKIAKQVLKELGYSELDAKNIGDVFSEKLNKVERK